MNDKEEKEVLYFVNEDTYYKIKKDFDMSTQTQQAKQQVCILCENIPMSKGDLIHDFQIPFDITDKNKETRILFDWAVENIDKILEELLAENLLVKA